MEKIGLIAGNRKFPLLFAQAARKKGCYVAAIAVKKDTRPELSRYVNKLYWLGLDEFSRLFEIFKAEGIKKVVMAGQISPRRLFSREVNKDPMVKELLSALKDKRADTIFKAIAEKLAQAGFELIDSTTFVEDHLPKQGLLTRRQPEKEEWDDVRFGMDLAKAVAKLDIGQTVAVKSGAIIAVEAFEGTDNLIRRAGRLSGGNMVVAKVSRPDQDMRFDIPVVGINTVKNLLKAKARCLAIEAGKTLFIDKEQAIALAEKKGLAIVAV